MGEYVFVLHAWENMPLCMIHACCPCTGLVNKLTQLYGWKDILHCWVKLYIIKLEVYDI